MATVRIGSWENVVSAVEVLLRPQGGPVLRLVLGPARVGPDSSQPLYELLAPRSGGAAEQRGTFEWEGAQFDFLFLGYRPHNPLDATPADAAVVGLVLEQSVLDWFASGPQPENASLRHLIYQRGPDSQDGSAWSVFDRMLGPAKCRRPMGFKDLDAAFPEGGCFLRPPERNNLAHLNHCVSLLAETSVEARGWVAFDDPKSPVRLLGLRAEPMVLSSLWQLRGGSHFVRTHPLAAPLGGSPPPGLVRQWGNLPQGGVAELLRMVTQSGLPETLGKGLVDDADQLPYCLGPADIGGKLPGYIDSICYRTRVPLEGGLCTLEVEVTFGLPPPPPAAPRQFESAALFGEWDEEGQRVALLPSGEGAEWAVWEDDKTPAQEQKLFARALTPYAARGEFAGFYVAYQPDDALLVSVREGGIPYTLGGQQVFSENLEIAELFLNSASVHISGRERTGAQQDADGVQVDGDSEEVRVLAGQTVDVKQGKLVVTDETTRLTNNLEGSGTATVDKEVVLKSTLEVGE